MSFADYFASLLWLAVATGAIAYAAHQLRRRLLPGWAGPPGWLATLVLALGLGLALGWLLGSFGALRGWSYLLAAVVAALAARTVADKLPRLPADPPLARPSSRWLTWISPAVCALVVAHFSVGVRETLGTGMTGFDSTWYHGPFAAGFMQSGDTFSLHFLAPQFLSWFYPQNSELLHGIGAVAFSNDLASPFLNLGWLVGCLLAAWCLGRPYGAGPLAAAGAAVVLGSGAFADQAGEARNDIVGAFFVLASIAVIANARSGSRPLTPGAVAVACLAAGLAAGTKLNFAPAALVLVAGAVWLAPPAARARAAAWGLAAAAMGGGYWYLRNLAQAGNPLPWANPLGLPGPDQPTGGRDGASVFGYLDDPSVVGDWFLPGMEEAFGLLWPVLLLAAVGGLLLLAIRRSGAARRVGALAGLALLAAWLFVSTSAPGPPGEPNGFVSGLRYLTPALAVGLALLACWAAERGGRWPGAAMGLFVVALPFSLHSAGGWPAGYVPAALAFGLLFLAAVTALRFARRGALPRVAVGVAASGAALVCVLAGQFVQSGYFENRYAEPTFANLGLDHAFAWAQLVRNADIATNATRQYPLFGEDLSNRVTYVGLERPHGGYVRPATCHAFRRALNEGRYDYLVASRDRLPKPGRKPYPPEAGWVAGAINASEVLRVPPTVVFEIHGPLDPDGCPEPEEKPDLPAPAYSYVP